jgi:SAM-dependent methyltransferase
VAGYVPEADLGLGCGIPTDIARINPGDTVLDLGSGAGNDVFVARQIVGERGRVIGVDMTEEMVTRAKQNLRKLRYDNIEFRLGEIENLPVAAHSVDVVISNCVLNLVPDKEKAFREIARVLKPGGHFSISDIVLQGELPRPVLDAAELYAACVSGAMQKSAYLDIITAAGFVNVTVEREREIELTDSVLQKYLTVDELARYRASRGRVLSITVTAVTPA